MTEERRVEIEKELAELRVELEEAEREFSSVLKQQAEKQRELSEEFPDLPEFTKEEDARAQELIDEQAKHYPNRRYTGELYEEQGEGYSLRDRYIYARYGVIFATRMAITGAGLRVGMLQNQIFILEHEDEILEWKRRNGRNSPHLTNEDLQEYRKYYEAINSKHFRSALGLELNKFPEGKKRKKTRQMDLGEMNIMEEEGVILEGLQDLSVPEEKAIAALQKLLEETNYEGNLPAIQGGGEFYKGGLPRLKITHGQYLEAYGVERRSSDGRLGGGAREAALAALFSLQKVRQLVAHTGFGKKRIARRLRSPLVNIDRLEEYEDYTEEELEAIRAGSDAVPPRASLLVISFSSLFVIGIENSFVLKPAGYHREIEAACGTKRPPKTVFKLLDYILTLDIREHRIRRDILIEKLGLEWLIKARKRKKLEEHLETALSVAKKLGYLKEYREELGVFHLSLNPERCKRVGGKKGAKDRRISQ